MEAGVESIKTRAHHETARPWGLEGPTLDEAFQGRERVPEEVRHAFHIEVGGFEIEEREACGIREIGPLDFYEQVTSDRVGIGRAHGKQEIPTCRRRRIPLPCDSHSRAIMS